MPERAIHSGRRFLGTTYPIPPDQVPPEAIRLISCSGRLRQLLRQGAFIFCRTPMALELVSGQLDEIVPYPLESMNSS